MEQNDELAVTYSALILADDDVPVTVSFHTFWNFDTGNHDESTWSDLFTTNFLTF